MTTTSLYSKIHALDMIAISNLGPLQPLELPTNMNYLLTSMRIHIHRTTPPQVPPMVVLTCQQRNSTRSTLQTSICLLLSPTLPLGNLPLPHPLADPTGPIFLPTNIYKLLSDVAIKELKKHNATTRSTPPPNRVVDTHDTDPHPENPPTDTPTGDPTTPDSSADPDLDNTEPCEAFTFDDSILEHIMDTYSPSYSINKTHIYHVSKHSSSHYGSLIDRGANG